MIRLGSLASLGLAMGNYQSSFPRPPRYPSGHLGAEMWVPKLGGIPRHPLVLLEVGMESPSQVPGLLTIYGTPPSRSSRLKYAMKGG